MTNSKHTPTPWKVKDLNIIHSDKFPIAEVFGYSVLSSELYQPKREANAEFIVRACNSYEHDQEVIKELLEACKRVSRLSEEWHKKENITADDFAYTQNVVDMLRQAIAKAEGK